MHEWSVMCAVYGTSESISNSMWIPVLAIKSKITNQHSPHLRAYTCTCTALHCTASQLYLQLPNGFTRTHSDQINTQTDTQTPPSLALLPCLHGGDEHGREDGRGRGMGMGVKAARASRRTADGNGLGSGLSGAAVFASLPYVPSFGELLCRIPVPVVMCCLSQQLFTQEECCVVLERGEWLLYRTEDKVACRTYRYLGAGRLIATRPAHGTLPNPVPPMTSCLSFCYSTVPVYLCPFSYSVPYGKPKRSVLWQTTETDIAKIYININYKYSTMINHLPVLVDTWIWCMAHTTVS
ncbi:hypothetical protein F5884DRAFT_82943 [Xylogone sp. PMI_703]|nr:hypothetical protein F5884DRAFT_82943 [Xylogone sp. PMI_703]